MSQPKISVIIPVYNAFKTLRRCLDSIAAQTYRDFEVILVDDGSKDESIIICEEYANVDSRFRVECKENGGASSARNRGLELAKGFFICFCDADDYVGASWLSDFLGNSESDLIIQGYYLKRSNRDFQKVVVSHNESFGSKRDLCKELISNNNIGYLWCRMFKKNIIDSNRLRFNEQYSIREDLAFILKYMLCCQSIEILPTCNYYYFEPEYHNKYNNYYSDYECTKEIIELYKELGLYNCSQFLLELDRLFGLAYNVFTIKNVFYILSDNIGYMHFLSIARLFKLSMRAKLVAIMMYISCPFVFANRLFNSFVRILSKQST